MKNKNTTHTIVKRTKKDDVSTLIINESLDLNFRSILKNQSKELLIILELISNEFAIESFKKYTIECESYAEALLIQNEIEESCLLQQSLDLEPINYFEFIREFERQANHFGYPIFNMEDNSIDLKFKIILDKDSIDSEYPLFDNLRFKVFVSNLTFEFSSLSKETVLKEISELNKEHFNHN